MSYTPASCRPGQPECTQHLPSFCSLLQRRECAVPFCPSRFPFSLVSQKYGSNSTTSTLQAGTDFWWCNATFSILIGLLPSGGVIDKPNGPALAADALIVTSMRITRRKCQSTFRSVIWLYGTNGGTELYDFALKWFTQLLSFLPVLDWLIEISLILVVSPPTAFSLTCTRTPLFTLLTIVHKPS